jgi:hypothetical protein
MKLYITNSTITKLNYHCRLQGQVDPVIMLQLQNNDSGGNEILQKTLCQLKDVDPFVSSVKIIMLHMPMQI